MTQKELEKLIEDIFKQMVDKSIQENLSPIGPNKLLQALAPDPSDKLVSSRGKTYREMFAKEDEILEDDGFDTFEEFIAAAHEKRDMKLKTLEEGDDVLGGYLVPPQYAAKLLDTALESEIVRPRATVWPMTSSALQVPGKEITSHATSISGVIAYWIAEKGEKDKDADPTFRLIQLIAKKLACYTKSSDELVADSKIPIGKVIGPAFTEAIGFYLDYAFFQGTGAGQPLGIINSPCLISVAKETGQPNGTIVWENIIKMWASLHPAGQTRSLWVASQSTIPQLLTLSQAIGTGGTHYWPALREAKTGGMTLLTRPIIWTEKLPLLGQEGDILLCDFSQYVIGMRQQVRVESSNAPHFSTDIKDWRAVLRADGQASWDKALTLKDGTTQVSPFVALAKRAA